MIKINKIDLRPYQDLAEGYFQVHDELFDGNQYAEPLLEFANEIMVRQLGHKTLLISGTYALTDDGPIFGPNYISTVDLIVPTAFLEVDNSLELTDKPLIDKPNWHNHGLGLALNEISGTKQLQEVESQPHLSDRHNWASTYHHLVVPFNQNKIEILAIDS